MKRLTILGSVLLSIIFMATSCPGDDPIIADFEDAEGTSIMKYIEENDSLFGNFKKILDTCNIGKVLTAYNPYGDGYTLFLPTDEAVEEFIAGSSDYSSLDALLGDQDFVNSIAQYHVVELGIDANDFPFGALPAVTLSEDYLTVSFVIGEDSAYYSINNQAPVVTRNIELSNGFIHVIGSMLKPITITSYSWLSNPDYSLFKEAVDLTGFEDLLNINLKEDEDNVLKPVTLFVEADSVYNKRGIYTMDDLLDSLECETADYTNANNPLKQFVGYHILDANAFLDDFFDDATNFTTYSDVPLNVNGLDLDIKINRGRQIFDTIVEAGDTTIIDFVGFDYDNSNVITQTGAIHIIDQVLFQQNPYRARVNFEFWEEPVITEFRNEPGEYVIDDSSSLQVLSWTGPELMFIEEADEEHTAWGDDYLFINGDFSVKYKIPKVVQGPYAVYLRANAFNELNAVVEIYIDGQKLGGLVDLTVGGSANWPFNDKYVGEIEFSSYETHVVEVRSLIPGRFEWDLIRFDPDLN